MASRSTGIWSTGLHVLKRTRARGRPAAAFVIARAGHGAAPAKFTARAGEFRTIRLDCESYCEGPMHLTSLQIHWLLSQMLIRLVSDRSGGVTWKAAFSGKEGSPKHEGSLSGEEVLATNGKFSNEDHLLTKVSNLPRGMSFFGKNICKIL